MIKRDKPPKRPHDIPSRIPLPSEKIPIASFVLLGLSLLCLVLVWIARRSVAFADFFNRRISSVFRAVFAAITNILPFSLAELLILLIPLFILLLILYAAKRKTATWRAVISYIVILLSGASVIFTLFVLNYGVGYYTTTLDEHLSLDQKPVTAEELQSTAEILAKELNTLAPEVHYELSGASIMPYSLSDMGDKLMDAYASFTDKHDFMQDLDSNIKPVLISEAMSYAHMTGVYTFFTGEANLNIDFPDYTLPYTAAHEFAHQRGIARENEANFIAFLICTESDDTYIRYCGYLGLYEYVASALYSADPTEDKSMYYGVREMLDEDIIGEMRAYSNFYSKYRDSTAGKINNSINNAFLQANGSAEGSKSYGLVVDLAVAYYKEK